MLGVFADSDFESTETFLLARCQGNAHIGGFSKFPDYPPDILHSFYSICWLAIHQSEETRGNEIDNVDLLKQFDVVLGICK